MPHASLPARYRRLVPLLIEGAPNKAIAQTLGLAPHTVELYVSEMMEVFGVGTRTALAMRLARMEETT